MLGSIEPVILIQLYKLIPETDKVLAKIPLVSKYLGRQTFAVIPIYLSEELTGLFIDNESKNIDIDTKMQGQSDGAFPLVNQSPLGSVTSISLLGKQGSIGLTILLALSELLIDKATSKEAEITYMNGAVTVFGGLLHSFSYEQGTNDDLYRIKFELSKGNPPAKSVEVGRDSSAARLPSTGTVPPANAPTAAPSAGGASKISPVRIGGVSGT